MTIETLETYHHHLKDIDSLELQLIKARNTVSSPNGKINIGGRSLTPSNKTEQAALEAGELEEALEAKRIELAKMETEIDDWLLSTKDPEITAIVRYHYLLGFNWKQTNLKVYGYPSYYRARKKIFRYFENI